MDREYDPDNDDPVSIRGRSRTFFLPIFVILVIFFRLAALFSIWLVYRGNRGG